MPQSGPEPSRSGGGHMWLLPISPDNAIVPTSCRVGRQRRLGRPSTDQLRDKACRLGAWSGRSSGPLSQSWVSWLISFFRSGGHWALRFQLAASVGGLPTAAVGSEHGPLDWPAEALHATLTIWPHIVPLPGVGGCRPASAIRASSGCRPLRRGLPGLRRRRPAPEPLPGLSQNHTIGRFVVFQLR